MRRISIAEPCLPANPTIAIKYRMQFRMLTTFDYYCLCTDVIFILICTPLRGSEVGYYFCPINHLIEINAI
jgi:hypothetical protein